jgi:hypothetical protein
MGEAEEGEAGVELRMRWWEYGRAFRGTRHRQAISRRKLDVEPASAPATPARTLGAATDAGATHQRRCHQNHQTSEPHNALERVQPRGRQAHKLNLSCACMKTEATLPHAGAGREG